MLLVDLVPVARGEAYGEFLTHGGHYEHWTRLAAMGPSALRRMKLPMVPIWSEYEEWPRGRVIYHVPTERFVVYADSQLQKAPWPEMIAQRFGLQSGAFDLRGDAHYVSLRRL
ncbi:hypothetical protein [Teichococcus vastitatis]|uniref:hypothetical protein n=1 Tax=Teichococcus vastitatis TaxID=2307076 RepID=UPI000E7590D0|nr:hypothetical protein [Pseudoroseomonas vastitatis]